MGAECDIGSLAWILGYKIDNLFSYYLGLPLGVSYKFKRIWELVIERILSKLDVWKTPPLSKGGRLILVKATLATIPNYFLSLFMILASVANRMKTMFKRFILDDGPDHNRYHLVDWNTCCRPLNNGGLGIKKI